MNKNSKDYYLDNINHKMEKLDLIKNQHEMQIVSKKELLEDNKTSIQKLKFTNDILKDQYNGLIRLIEKQGLIFEVNFSGYVPHEWENMVIVKLTKGYQIQSKTGNVLLKLDEKYSKIIGDINKKKFQSLIVIRVTDKTSWLQLKFN